MYDRTGTFLTAFGLTDTTLPATTLTPDGQPVPERSGEDLGMALTAAALSPNAAAQRDQLALHVVNAAAAGTLPARLNADGTRAGDTLPDAEIRAALWGVLGPLTVLRWPGADGALQDQLLGHIERGLNYTERLIEQTGTVILSGAHLLRETALAGLTLYVAGRVLRDQSLLATGLNVTERLRERFRSPREPWTYAASISRNRASLAPDTEGFALAGLLALAYDLDVIPDELLRELDRAATRALIPVTWAPAVNIDRDGGFDFYDHKAQLVTTSPDTELLTVTNTVNAAGYGDGLPGTLSGRATALAAAFEARALATGRAAATLSGLNALRVPTGPLSHAVRGDARAETLSLAASVIAECALDPRLLA